MALFNYASKEITLKVVYYGPGLCGKTTNLQQLHNTMASDKKGKLLSLSTDADRTLFFDFMPVQLGKIKDFNIRFQLYTVPGQVRYNATRKLVLKGADAVVFVADSQSAMKEQNIESFQNMRENLIANNINPDEIPVVLQYNKRDLKKIMPVDELNKDLNTIEDEVIEASAYEGWGVDETFHLVTKRLLKFISKKHNVKIDEEPVDIMQKPAPKPAAAAKEPPVIEEAPAPPEMPEDAVEVSVAPSTETGSSSDWSDLLEGHEEPSGGGSGWEGGSIDLEAGSVEAPQAAPAAEAGTAFDIDDAEGALDASELERVLMEEEVPGEGDYSAGHGDLSAVREELNSLRSAHEKLAGEFRKLKEQIQPILQLARKKAVKK